MPFQLEWLKETLSFTDEIVTDMMNRFLTQGKFPKQLKLARVGHFPKVGGMTVNYRPTLVLTILSKLF